MNKYDKKALEEYNNKLLLAKEGSGEINIYETDEEKKKRIHAAKKSYKKCVEYYFPRYATAEVPDFHIEFANYIKKHQTAKAFAEWGRGLAKSVVCNITIPFWLWINEDINFFVLIGQNEDKAKDLLDDLRAEFEGNQRIINDFGEQKKIGSWESGDFQTQSGFIAKAFGLGQDVRGIRVGAHRPDHISCDDLEDKKTVKNPKRQHEEAEWIETSLLPTMDGTRRRFTYACNRHSPNMIQIILQERHPSWHIHHVKAYDPTTYKPIWHQKYSDTHYQELEKEFGVISCKQEYNGEPYKEGKIFKEEHKQMVKLPRIDHFHAIVCHWDVAYAGNKSSDHNACRVWGVKDNNFYLIDCYVRQSKMRPAVDWMCYFKKTLPEGINIRFQFEGQFWNGEVKRTIAESEAANNIKLNLIQVPTRGNKYFRILNLEPYFQNARIYFNKKIAGKNDFIEGWEQTKGIEPNYKTHDDAPDADEFCIHILEKFIPSTASKPLTGSANKKSRW